MKLFSHIEKTLKYLSKTFDIFYDLEDEGLVID